MLSNRGNAGRQEFLNDQLFIYVVQNYMSKLQNYQDTLQKVNKNRCLKIPRLGTRRRMSNSFSLCRNRNDTKKNRYQSRNNKSAGLQQMSVSIFSIQLNSV